MIHAYLDNNATTQLAPEALAAMLPFLTKQYLNPSSMAGQLLGSYDVVQQAKAALARLLGDVELAKHFTLTSGASEANSWAVASIMAGAGSRRIVTTAIEHPSLLEAVAAQARNGAEVAYVQPNESGWIEPDTFAATLTHDTAFVSVMAANNETGVVQPIGLLAEIVRRLAPEAILHVDATQVVGRIPVDLTDEFVEVDLLSLSAHKFHGPKGVGALYIRDGLQLEPLIYGEQEDGRRGGTLNTAAAAGLHVAAEQAARRLAAPSGIEALRNNFERELAIRLPQVHFNGVLAQRLPNTCSLTIPGHDADAIVERLAMRGVCLSTGSACRAGSPAPSHVLTAMGISYEDAKATLRVSLSAFTSEEDLKLATTEIVAAVNAELQNTQL
ncbi:cysteine desulfurase family protein [Mesorhizobium sp.]|uniref:cysteine desulfurase family protein n=1 Tax=Mesorhizobium sp. TaxID=1871066 RepID=UPI001205D777|nr:cysteine desulfurase family protein [Mesorhizobium sp.]TIL65607.1 MAG: cysteine desulfurase [Mesorhizobium sp.]